MGRKKKAQRGKSLGRNQLIMEYIYQRTGALRERKQISSHVQALGKIFHGVEECKSGMVTLLSRWLTSEGFLATADLRPDNAKGCDYYSDSIADHVRIERQLMAATEAKQVGSQLPWTENDLHTFNLRRVSFDLWIRSPEPGSQALHNYTRMPASEVLPPPSPLESLKDWRNWFPDLDNILQSSGNQLFDIVLIKSSLALMTDFPPSNAQLVLQYELNFQHALCENHPSLDTLKFWSSTNHIYYNGHLQGKSVHKNRLPNGPGIISPPFEVEFWAKQFSNLAEKRKEAEYEKDEIAIASAEEYSRGLFRGLTMVQEIFASPTSDENTSTHKRMAVLLWQFSKVGKTHTGITKWQKLIPPPNRKSTNSPSPLAIDSTLPPLDMDSTISDDLMTDMALDSFAESFNGAVTYPASPPSYQVGDYYSGFTPMQITRNGQVQPQLPDLPVEYYGNEFTANCETNGSSDINCDAFDFSVPPPLPNTISYLPSAPTPKVRQYTKSSHTANPGLNVTDEGLVLNQQVASSDLFEEPINRRQALANFDINTHRLLQAQLEDYDADSSVCSYPQSQCQLDTDSHSQSNHQDVCLGFSSSVPDSQSSVIHQMGDLGIGEDLINQTFGIDNDDMLNEHSNISQEDINSTTIALENHPCVFDSPKVSRPPLMTHHSWAGITASTTEDHSLFAFDTPTRDDFAHLMTSIEGMSQHGVGLETGMQDDFLTARSDWTSIQGQALPTSLLYRMHSQPATAWSEREQPIQRSLSIGNNQYSEHQLPTLCLESRPVEHEDGGDINDEDEWTEVKVEEDLNEQEFATITPNRILIIEAENPISPPTTSNL